MSADAVGARAQPPDVSPHVPDASRRSVVAFGVTPDLERVLCPLFASIDGGRCEPRFARSADDVRLLLAEESVILLIVVTDGLLAAQIQSIARHAARHPHLQHCPVLFLMRPGHEAAVNGCQSICRSYFMDRTLPTDLLQANVASLIASIRRAEELEAMRARVSESLEQNRNELDVAKRILDNILQSGVGTVPHIRTYLQSMERLNGDMVLVQKTPAGKDQILVGDFSGHGLTAAVGGMIAADIFNAMTLKGYRIDEIATQINRKLNRILPTGLYMAACLIEWDMAQGTMVMWNGGLPEVLLRHETTGSLARLRDGHPPLGILPPAEFSAAVRRIPIDPGCRAYIYSDGLIETRNPRREMWGSAGLLASLQADVDPSIAFDVILQRVAEFRGSEPLHDDVTMVELTFPDGGATLDRPEATAPITARLDLGVETITTKRSISLRLDASTIAATDPVPCVMQVLQTFSLSERNRSDVFVILRELVANAIDHGLLGLSSELKSTPDGFNEYYRLRDERLARLLDGFIDIRISHEQASDGSSDSLRIRIEDSGDGFDHRKIMSHTTEASLISEALSGRGVALLRTICRELQYNDAGNAVEALYRLTRRQQR